MRRFFLVMLAACGSTSAGNGADSLDCAYLAGSDNCWKTTAGEVQSCLPAGSAVGVLSSDNASCTYATGQVVMFTTPLTLPLPDSPKWDFEVLTSSGEQCMKYQETSTSIALWNGLCKTVSESTSSGEIELACPDGTTWSNSNPSALLSCPSGDFGGLPGNTTSSTADSVTFSLLNTSSGTLQVFNCSH